tara:strand:+ start:228 stop:515 length:288 start_codon:yes stop_codon:yes gene_type:complete
VNAKNASAKSNASGTVSSIEPARETSGSAENDEESATPGSQMSESSSAKSYMTIEDHHRDEVAGNFILVNMTDTYTMALRDWTDLSPGTNGYHRT